MDEEFNKSLNEEFKEKYQNAKKLLDERIEALANTISNAHVSDFTSINEAITKMKKLSAEISEILKRLENEEVDFYETALFEDVKSEKSWNKKTNSLEKNTKKLSNLDDLKTKLNSIDTDKYKSLINRGNKVLERRIASLQKKKGRIQKNQRKLLNKRLAKILKSNIKMANSLIKNNHASEKNNIKIEKLNSKKSAIESQKAELAKVREILKSGKISIGVSSSIPLFINEKVIRVKIKSLQKKKGRITRKEKHIIKKNIGKSLQKKK